MNELNFKILKMEEEDSSSTMINKNPYALGAEAEKRNMLIEGVQDNLTTRFIQESKPSGQVGEDDHLSIWISAIPLIALVVINVLANGAIILIFIRRRCIRRCRNIYILSIALADLFIGLSMPFSIVETLNKHWTFWPFACWVFLMVRYSLFFISFISIILLTIDRWWSINFPFSYRVRQSRKLATILVVCCWLVSFILHIPLVLGWENFKSDSATKTYCRIPDERNLIFTLCAFVLEYLFPMTLLFMLNIGIYMKLLRRRNTTKIRRSMSTSDNFILYSRKTSSDSGGSSNNNNLSLDEQSEVNLIFNPHHSLLDNRRHSVYLYSTRRASSSFYKVPKTAVTQFQRNNCRVSFDGTALYKARQNSPSFNKTTFPTRKQSDDVVKDFLGRQDKKAILSLGLLTLVASVCWTPYIISSVVYAFCPTCIPQWMTLFFYWILAANSAINPFLYGIGNPDFRKVLRSWLSCLNYQNNYKMQDTLLYCQLQQQNPELETLRENIVITEKNRML